MCVHMYVHMCVHVETAKGLAEMLGVLPETMEHRRCLDVCVYV